VISGLAFSTILTLIMIPVMIALPSVWVGSARSIVQRFRRKPAPAAAPTTDADQDVEWTDPEQEKERPAAKVVSMPKPAPPKVPNQEELPHAAE
jgi:multidrug efflux pump